MAEVNEICIIEVTCDQLCFVTQTNGDSISLSGLELSREQATSLAWLINSGEETTLQIKIRITP